MYWSATLDLAVALEVDDPRLAPHGDEVYEEFPPDATPISDFDTSELVEELEWRGEGLGEVEIDHFNRAYEELCRNRPAAALAHLERGLRPEHGRLDSAA